jgi:hypothetical protein
MAVLDSMSDLPWLWLVIFFLLYHLARNLLRSFNIAMRGWPPDYLDADGDYKRKTETESEE